MKKILKHIDSKEWIQIGIISLFIVLQVWLELRIPEYMSAITQIIQTPGSEIRTILITGGKMLLCALGSFIVAVLVGFIAARVAASFAQRLRSLIYDKVDSFSMEEINKFSTSSLITRSTNDVTQIQMLVTMGLQLLIKAPIMAIWAITKISGKGFQWSVATGIAVLLILLVVSLVMTFVTPKFKEMQTLTDNLTRVTRENLTGVRVVRAYNAERYQEEKFEEANDDLTNTTLFTNRRMSILMPTISSLMSSLSLAVYWIGATLINTAAISDKIVIFSDMVVFSNYAMQVIMSFMMLVIVFIMYPRAAVSAKRINEVLDTVPSIIEGTDDDGIPGVHGEVTFKNVSFKYPDAEEYVIRDISFTVRQGETVAFIGSTGSGKSTLVKLVPRFFDASKGEVLVNGKNVKDYKFAELYNKIGYVPQKSVMFKGTINSNVAYGENGKEAPDQNAVKHAIEIAQATDFVEEMNGQYEAPIARGGTNVSGGQKQRLAIARAICREPEIYIFDDSFSALDYKTDRTLRSALKKETANVTSMIVAQRIGTIMDAEQIIVLDKGRMVGKGTHSELIQNCDVYREIAMSQFSEEELIS